MANEAVTIAITAKSVGVDEELKKTKSKFDNLNKSLIGDKATDAVKGMTQSLKGLSSMGESLGGTFKNIIGGFTSMLTPIGLVTAAISGLIAMGVNLFKKLTLSSEEYLAYLNHAQEQNQKRLDKVNQRETDDRGYFERLKQLNQTEQISNAIKSETILLIQILTKRYGDLGLSIDETTGKIVGLDSAMNRFEDRINKMKLKELKNIANTQGQIADESFKAISYDNVSGIDAKVKDFRSFMSPAERSKWAMGNQYASDNSKRRMKKWNGEAGYSGSWDDEKIPEYEKMLTELQSKIEALQKKRQQNGGKLSVLENEELAMLEKKKQAYAKLLPLYTKLAVAEEMIKQTASDPAQNKKWKDLALSIENLISKTEKYNLQMEKSDIGQIGRLNRAKALANELLQLRLKGSEAEKQTANILKQQKDLIKQYELNRKDKAEKIQHYQSEINGKNDKKGYADYVVRTSKQDMPFIDKQFGERYDALLQKEKDQTITDDEKWALNLYRKIFGQRLQIYRDAKKQFETLKNKENRTASEQREMERLQIVLEVQSTDFDTLKKEQKRLQDQVKNGTIFADDFTRLLEINKQIAIIETKIKQGKAQQVSIEKEIVDLQLKQKQIKDELNDYFKDGIDALTRELQMQEAIKAGDLKAIERQKILNELKAKGYDFDKLKKQGIDINAEIDKMIAKRQELSKVQYMNGQTKNLDRQIQLITLKLQGKLEEIERQKLLNDLEDKKIALDQKEIDLLMKKKKELKQLQFQDNLRNQARDLLYQAQSKFGNKKQAEIDKRTREFQKQYGTLTDEQKDKIKELVEIELKIDKYEVAKPDFKQMDIKTNELTARGGFQTGAVVANTDRINTEIKNYAAKQANLLSAIKSILEKGGYI